VIGDRDEDMDDISPIVDRVDDLLHDKRGQTSSGVVFSLYRRRSFDIPYNLTTGTYPRRILRFEFINR
jgi:hypothetical protein